MVYQRPDVLALIKQNYFTIGIFVCIILAEIEPRLGAQGGPLKPEITVRYLAVCVIFYTSGLTIKWKELSLAVKQFKLHAFIQGFSFGFIPVFIHVFIFVFGVLFEVNSWIRKGLLIVGCMPPPVSSAVILTKSIGGNEAAAVFNSALGSILGIVLTPLLLLIHVGISSPLPMLRMILQLGQTMVLPVVLGQVSQKLFSPDALSRLPVSFLSQASLLFIIYTSFCDMFSQEDGGGDAHLILLTVFFVVVIQVILLLTTFNVSSFLSKRSRLFSAQDVVTITFCSTHKSLTLGMPLLKTLYGGYSHMSHISLPLLVYHPVQLILGGFVVPHARKWLKDNSKVPGNHKRP